MLMGWFGWVVAVSAAATGTSLGPPLAMTFTLTVALVVRAPSLTV